MSAIVVPAGSRLWLSGVVVTHTLSQNYETPSSLFRKKAFFRFDHHGSTILQLQFSCLYVIWAIGYRRY